MNSTSENLKDDILKTFLDLITKYRVIDVEEVSIECEKYSYKDVLEILEQSTIPLIKFPNSEIVPLIIRNDANCDSDVRLYLSRYNLGYDAEDAEYLENNWNTFEKYNLGKNKNGVQNK